MNKIAGHSNTPSNTDSTNRSVARFAAALLVIALPAMGLFGCAQPMGSQPGSKPVAHAGANTVKHDGPATRTNANGKFLAPTHPVSLTFKAGVDKGFTITTKWSTGTGFKLSQETVSAFLMQVGTTKPQYCQTTTILNPSGNTFGVPFTFTVGPDSSATGNYAILCYITGKLSDGSDVDPMSHNHGTTGHCTSTENDRGHHHRKHHHQER